MEKFWYAVALLAIGFIGGAITWNYIDVKTILKGNFKVKQRGKGNTQDTDLELNLPPLTKRESRKEGRWKKRAAKRNKRNIEKFLKRMEEGGD